MNITVLLPNKQNDLLAQKIKSLLGQNDRLLAFDIPKFPARKIDEMIWREIPDLGVLIVLMNPNTIDLEPDFFEAFRMFHTSPTDVLIRSPLEIFEEFYPESNVTTIRPSDCIAFHRSLYKRQLTDISPHADFTVCIKEIIRACGHTKFFIPQRSDLKIQEIQHREEMKIIENQQKQRNSLIARLESIREKRRVSEEERSRKVEQISRLQFELSQLDVEIKTNETYLRDQEIEIKKLEEASIAEYKQKEKQLADIQDKIWKQEAVLENLRMKMANGNINEVENSLERRKRKEMDAREIEEYQRRKRAEHEAKLREQVKRVSGRKKVPGTPKKEREYIHDDPQARRMVLSEVPKTKQDLVHVKKIDWD